MHNREHWLALLAAIDDLEAPSEKALRRLRAHPKKAIHDLNSHTSDALNEWMARLIAFSAAVKALSDANEIDYTASAVLSELAKAAKAVLATIPEKPSLDDWMHKIDALAVAARRTIFNLEASKGYLFDDTPSKED